MSGQFLNGIPGPKAVWQFQEIYVRAKAVKAKYPETHAASQAARKLLDAFESVIHADGKAWGEIWLLASTPRGNA